MIPRDIEPELQQAAKEYPVVTVFGPRQSGKTTLVRMVFPKKQYRSLEDPDVRAQALADPRGFFSDIEEGAVLDEIQRAPELLSYIQGIVDLSKQRGRFILTGSHQPELHAAVSQTLAGRTALLTLLPFCFNELRRYTKTLDAFELIVKGSFPRLHDEQLQPARFFNGYLRTYVERDVRALINLKDLRRFQQFLTLLAGRVGQVINYTSLGNDVGVSSSTIKSWVSVLTSSYVVAELSPYFENVGKRVIRSPKIYFTDMGLVAFLLGISTPELAARDPLRGNLFENLVIMEILKRRLNAGLRNDLFFYRDTHGNEVDLIIRRGRKLIPIEIKSSATFTSDFHKGIERFRAVVAKAEAGFIAYNGEQQSTFKGTKVFNPLLHEDVMKTVG
ncbi:MAG: ATP-binding protein [Ignavibacteriae bacterium]|nr:ATP-binding protein [Ignavibacteriota bacterium]